MTNDMNNTEREGRVDALERELEAMTRWAGGEVGAWRSAAVSAGLIDAGATAHAASAAGAWKKPSIWQRPISQTWLGIAAVIVLAGVVISAMLPALGTARSSVRAPASPSIALDGLRADELARRVPTRDDRVRGKVAGGYASVASGDASHEAEAEAMKSIVAGPEEDTGTRSMTQSGTAAERHVIRKATIELKTSDVRATFAKVGLLLSEAEGEYLEASTLSGDGASATGQLTLRVSAARLSRVLNELRALGTVTSENAGGEDVTDKVVDLEARIRNEQRVEGELLELLKKQSDAKLRDVLELRGEINRVRERIEQLMGQREKLGRLTSLATVLVLIRAEDAPPVVKQGALGEFFAKAVGDSWNHGVKTLIETVAFLVRLIVGGLVWWIVLVGAATGVVVLRRRAAKRRANEPAPAI